MQYFYVSVPTVIVLAVSITPSNIFLFCLYTLLPHFFFMSSLSHFFLSLFSLPPLFCAPTHQVTFLSVSVLFASSFLCSPIRSHFFLSLCSLPPPFCAPPPGHISFCLCALCLLLSVLSPSGHISFCLCALCFLLSVLPHQVTFLSVSVLFASSFLCSPHQITFLSVSVLFASSFLCSPTRSHFFLSLCSLPPPFCAPPSGHISFCLCARCFLLSVLPHQVTFLSVSVLFASSFLCSPIRSHFFLSLCSLPPPFCAPPSGHISFCLCALCFLLSVPPTQSSHISFCLSSLSHFLVVVPVKILSMSQISLFKNYLYLIRPCENKNSLKKQLNKKKKWKYERTMNMIPKPLGIK